VRLRSWPTQPLADGKVACVVDGGFGAGAHFPHLGNLFEVLFDAGVLVINMQRGNHAVGHAEAP